MRDKTTVLIDKETHRKLKAASGLKGLSMTEFIDRKAMEELEREVEFRKKKTSWP